MDRASTAGGVAAIGRGVREKDSSRPETCTDRQAARAARFAATAGEDYALLVAMPDAARTRLRGLGCRLTRIGTVTKGAPRARFVGADGRAVALAAGGFDHFR